MCSSAGIVDARRPVLHVVGERGAQAEVVERGRAQLPDQMIDVAIELLRDGFERARCARRDRASRAQASLRLRDLAAERRQLLAELVVHLARDAAALVFLREHEPRQELGRAPARPRARCRSVEIEVRADDADDRRRRARGGRGSRATGRGCSGRPCAAAGTRPRRSARRAARSRSAPAPPPCRRGGAAAPTRARAARSRLRRSRASASIAASTPRCRSRGSSPTRLPGRRRMPGAGALRSRAAPPRPSSVAVMSRIVRYEQRRRGRRPRAASRWRGRRSTPPSRRRMRSSMAAGRRRLAAAADARRAGDRGSRRWNRSKSELPSSCRRLAAPTSRSAAGVGEHDAAVAADDDAVGRALDQPAKSFVRVGHSLGSPAAQLIRMDQPRRACPSVKICRRRRVGQLPRTVAMQGLRRSRLHARQPARNGFNSSCSTRWYCSWRTSRSWCSGRSWRRWPGRRCSP